MQKSIENNIKKGKLKEAKTQDKQQDLKQQRDCP